MLVAGYLIYQKQPGLIPWLGSRSVTINGPAHTPTPVSTPQPSKSSRGILSDEWREYFISDILPKYPEFQKTINSKDIKRVSPLSLKGDNPEAPPYKNWLVEIKTSISKYGDNYNYYLVTPEIQKQLIDPLSSMNEGSVTNCMVEHIYTPGSERNLGRDLLDKKGYLVLSGVCDPRFSGNSVSVYKLSDAEKVKLEDTGSLIKSYPTYFPTKDKKGNTLGRVRGVYGVNKPILVVDYGYFKDAINKIEEVQDTAYFDLQTGQLKQVVKFN